MRALALIATLASVGLAWVPAAAQDVEALRQEVAKLQKQLQSLTERLQRLPSSPAPAAAPAPATTPVVGQAPQSSGQPTLTDLAQPRPPFSLAERRGGGQLLFDIGLAADFVGNFVQENVDRADVGTFPGRENRFFPREVELSLFGQIDPYARGEVRIEAAEEFEDGARELHVGLAEANFTLLALPFGTQVKGGLLRNRFGLLNERHQHDLPFIDRPNVLVRFLGEEGLVESGAEFTWVPPLPFYLEALVGVFNGDNEVAFGRGSLRHPLLTGRLRTFFELGDAGGIQLGISGARGTATQDVVVNDFVTPQTLEFTDDHRSAIVGADLKYKFTPEGWRHALLTFGSEALYSMRRATVVGDPDGDGVEHAEQRDRDRFGWYVYTEVQPWRRWAAGVRYDSTQFPVDPGREWAVEPYVAFMPSEFLRFRLGYKHTDRSHRVTSPSGLGSGRILDELLFQATFILGAHPAHPF